MDTDMEYLPLNNIKQEVIPTSAMDANENSNNNNQAAPDSVENKVSGCRTRNFLLDFLPVLIVTVLSYVHNSFMRNFPSIQHS